MSYAQLVGRVCFCAFALAGLSHCGGGKNKSSAAAVQVTPENPIVITADIEADDKIYNAPWFSFKVDIDNQTDQAFEIVALEAEIKGTDASGMATTKKVAWAPGSLDYTLDDLQCKYITFGIWDKGIKKKLQIYGTGSCRSGDVLFIADDNPSGPNGKSFRNRVKIKPLGYFITDEGDPDDRFEKIKTFFTK